MKELFKQYEDQQNIKIESVIKKDIFEQSEVAQGLTTLFGKYLSEEIIGEKKIVPTSSEWKSLVYGTDLLEYADSHSVNLQKMIKSSKEVESCQKAPF